MATAEQSECETYRIIILGGGGTQVLLVPEGDRFALLSVAIPRWQRVAEDLTAAVKTDWGEEVICLLNPDAPGATNGSGIRYQATEHWCSNGRPKMPSQWVPVSALSPDSLIDASDYLAISQSLAKCIARTPESPAGPFVRLGWFKALCDWAEAAIEPAGFRLNGNFRQLNASPSFSLVRLETDGPALWFKAVGEPNQKEFPITSTVAQLFPSHLPRVLAVRPDWNGWLTCEVAGNLLCEVLEPALWERAASALANLQIESIDHGARILAAGARDLGTVPLSKLIQPFMEKMAQLMERQTKFPPPVLNRKELLLLGDRVQNAVDALEALGIPETLGHLDLNPGNIIVSPKGCVFLDWAEAYVGHPFFSFQYLLEHFRRTVGVNSACEAKLTSSYLGPWGQIAQPEFLAEVMALAPLLAVFAYAAGTDAWKHSESTRDPRLAGYFRALARRMNREADQLINRGVPCLS